MSFSFTPFNDSLSTIGSYQWGLGSEPGLDNVIALRPYNGTIMVSKLSMACCCAEHCAVLTKLRLCTVDSPMCFSSGTLIWAVNKIFMFLQTVPEVAIGGKVFKNATLRVQNIMSPFLSLVTGETYFVVVQATNAGAQRLSGRTSSVGVKVLAIRPASYITGRLPTRPAQDTRHPPCHTYQRITCTRYLHKMTLMSLQLL